VNPGGAKHFQNVAFSGLADYPFCFKGLRPLLYFSAPWAGLTPTRYFLYWKLFAEKISVKKF
jgi:hypothetical protein